MTLLTIEYILLSAIGMLQLILFFRSRDNIKEFKQCIPLVDQFDIKVVYFTETSLREQEVNYILKLVGEREDQRNDPKKASEVRLQLVTCTEQNAIVGSILYAINTYLIKNQAAAADFNLLKDMVERYTDAQDRDISITLPLPLYAGLAATMFGIVIGLVSMGDISAIGRDLTGADRLFKGVSIAMSVSLLGLALTSISSGWLYKGAKSQVQDRKNELYTFLQVELLPVLSANVNAGILTLNRSIDAFSHRFHEDLQHLQSIVKVNHDTLNTQQKVLETLENIDATRIAKINLNLFKEFEKNVGSLEKLNGSTRHLQEWLNQLNHFIDKTASLNQSVQQVLSKGNDLGQLTEVVREVVSGANQQQQFLRSHFSELEERGKVINTTVAKLDDILDKSLTELAVFTRKKIEEFKKQSVKWDVQIENSFQSNAGALEKLNRLEDIHRGFDQLTKTNEALLEAMQELSGEQKYTARMIVRAISRQKSRYSLKPFFSQLKKMFDRLFSSR